MDDKQDKQLIAIQEALDKVGAQCERLSITKQDEETFLTLRTDVISKVNRAIAQIEDVNSKVDSTDNYLARYLPFN